MWEIMEEDFELLSNSINASLLQRCALFSFPAVNVHITTPPLPMGNVTKKTTLNTVHMTELAESPSPPSL